MSRTAAVVIGVVLALVVAAPASATAVPSSVTWSRGASLGSHSGGGVTCTSTTQCWINDFNDTGGFFSLRDPLKTSAPIRRLKLGAGIEPWTVTCESSPLLCVAGTRDDRIVASTHPTRGRFPFHTVGRISQGVANVVCSGTFCAVGSASGFAFSATPTKRGSWVRHPTPPHSSVEFANCSATGTCIATQGTWLWTLDQPQTESHRWRFKFLDPQAAFDGGDCFGTACIAPTRSGQIFTNTDVTNGSGTWTSSDVGHLLVEDVECVSMTRCYADAAKRSSNGFPTDPRYLLYSNNPFDTAPIWYRARVPISSAKNETSGLSSCPTTRTCFVELDTLGAKRTVKARLLVAHLPVG